MAGYGVWFIMFIYVGGGWGEKTERKAFHALLLPGIVAAGAMTITDVYAQTNTDRLIAVAENTDGLPGMLDSIMGAVSDGVASVLAAIAGLQTHVDDGLMAIDADLMAIHGDLANVDADLVMVHEDLMAIDADLVSVHEDLVNVDADLVTVHEDLITVHNDLEMMDAEIHELADSVNSLGATASELGAIAAANSETQAGVEANSAAINELKTMLMGISDNLGVVQNQTAPVDEEAMAVGLSNMLHSDKTVRKVTVADFTQSVTEHPDDNEYNASSTFSCDGNVFLDTMMVSDPADILSTVLSDLTDADDAGPMSTVSVNGYDLYDVFDNSGSNSPTTANQVNRGQDREFDNQFLPANTPLVIKGMTDQSSNTNPATAATPEATNHLVFDSSNDTVAAMVYFTLEDYVGLENAKATIQSGVGEDGQNPATKAQLGAVPLYTIEVTWFSPSSDTTCSISSATGTTMDLDVEDTELVSLEVTGDDTLKDFKAVSFDCGGQSAEIQSISIALPLELREYTTLMIGDEEVTFASDGSVDSDNLPIAFTGAVTIEGEGTATTLLSVTYATVDNNSCSAESIS